MARSSEIPPREARIAERAFRIAAVPGVTLTKWTRAWSERFPDIPLEVVRSTEPSQLWAVREGLADVAFVRSQASDDEHSLIALYDESPVIVVPAGHPLSDTESVVLADVSEENHLAGDAADAIELVAANVGVVVVPHSIARLHARKDVVAVPITDAPATPVAIAWTAGSTDARIEEFVGIVRGRTARSSRSAASASQELAPKAAKKAVKSGKPSSKKPTRKPTAAEARAAANRRKRQGR